MKKYKKEDCLEWLEFWHDRKDVKNSNFTKNHQIYQQIKEAIRLFCLPHCCQDFESAIDHNEIIKELYPSGIKYYINFHFYKSNDEYKKQRIYYCPWCGNCVA